MRCEKSANQAVAVPRAMMRGTGVVGARLASRQASAGQPKHVYGIIEADNELCFGAIGLNGAVVHTAECAGLAAVLSDHPGSAAGNTSQVELVRQLLTHQAVLEKVMATHTVLPVQFGTVLASTEEVLRLLSQGHGLLAKALADIRGKVEVEVAATWDTERVLAEVAGEKEILETKEALARSPSPPSVQERMRLGQMVKQALDRRRDAYRERMMTFLKALAQDVQPNALLSDRMVLNVAFLLDEARQNEFHGRVEQLDKLFDDQVDFRIVGPLPPYTFCTVHVGKPDWDEVREAKQVLGLGEMVSASAVRRAYRDLAARAHPDLHPGDETAQGRFARVQAASAVLMAYCRGLGDPRENYSVTKQAVERALLVSVRRSTSCEVESFRFGGFATERWAR